MGGVAVPITKRCSADASSPPFPVDSDSVFICDSVCTSEPSYALICHCQKSLGSSLDGGFPWEG
jgi:hypothetical protein